MHRCWLISDPEDLNYLQVNGRWERLQSIVMFQAECKIGETITQETRFYQVSKITPQRYYQLCAIIGA
jgi:hypothetical protein